MTEKVCETYVGTADKAVTDVPTLVYWAWLEPATLATEGTLAIRDGFSASDEERARIVDAYGYPRLFNPPLRCAHGLFMDMDAAVTSYTVGYIKEKNLPD